MLSLQINGRDIALDIGHFPAGETRLRIRDPLWAGDKPVQRALITCEFRSNDDLINLLLLTDAVRRFYVIDGRCPAVALVLRYLPYARQDRVCAPGEPLSLKVIATLLNAQRYQAIYCADAHSDVALALLNNVHHVRAAEYAPQLATPGMLVVAPDAGAARRAREFAAAIKAPPVITAEKVRDLETGAITGTRVHCDDLAGADVMIVDDICDGGATFVALARALRERGAGRVLLYVTHGIFSRGVDHFSGLIDRIYTANNMADLPHPLILTLKP